MVQRHVFGKLHGDRLGAGRGPPVRPRRGLRSPHGEAGGRTDVTGGAGGRGGSAAAAAAKRLLTPVWQRHQSGHSAKEAAALNDVDQRVPGARYIRTAVSYDHA